MAPSGGQKHVVIVGAGAAGMSCAATLAQHPAKFKITVIEKGSVCGGQATSISLDEKKFGASWMNNGVQGGSPIFKHTFNFFHRYRHDPEEVQLQVSFGKGKAGFWTNVFPSHLVEQHSKDIKKFGIFLKLIKYTMPILGLIPIRIMLRLMFFSKDFGDKMVYPLIALFLGTGNQTANVPSAIVERLFDDPNMRLWDYDPDTLLPNLPKMVTFDKLHDFYEDWREDLVSRGVEIRLDTEVTQIIARSSKDVLLRTAPVNGGEGRGGATEVYDEMVMCTLADDSLRILGKNATFLERFVLGGAKFYDDITVTHWDSEYFNKHYETDFDADLCATPKTAAQKDQVIFARGDDATRPAGFRPMYYTKTYPQDPKKIEMSFDCSNYQHQLLKATGTKDDAGYPHVYQTIFLDKRSRDLWTWPEIDKDKIIAENWWHQLGHRWSHYLRVVPLMNFINGRNSTLFAGSWTLVNMHELACVSGIAAAYRMGADYSKFDDFAENFFSKYLAISHGVLYSWEEKRRRAKK
ncbi:All-trans-zeta-carotene desaturase [Cytospora mali]|uniref:All-trans-zeta-carotene desaturase n=1 Tax=Cytospora mali TaxID=578113 RepID=A0A194UZ83_CYTMA|nr:All-trans-zeta-carotene desaturase [Valsa mali var. pyri (nom. inval.)]